jgi:hypothetical protein
MSPVNFARENTTMGKAVRLFGRVAKQELTFYFLGNSVPPTTLRMPAREADQLTTDIASKLYDARGLNGGSLITLGTGDEQSFVSVVAIAKIDRRTVFEGYPRVELYQDGEGRPYLREAEGETAYPVDYIDPSKFDDGEYQPDSQFTYAAYNWVEGEYDPSDGAAERTDRKPLWLPDVIERLLTHVATFHSSGERVDVLWINDDDGTTGRPELEPVATGETLRYLGEGAVKRARERA